MRLAKAAGLRLGSEDVYEAKFGGHIVWPIYRIQTYPLPELYFNAWGGERVMYVSLYAYNEDEEQIRVESDIDASRFTVTKVASIHDPFNQITYEKVLQDGKYRLVFKGADLGTNDRSEASAIFRISMPDKGVTLDVNITQQENVMTTIQRHEETTGYGNLLLYPVPEGGAISDVPIVGGLFTVVGTIVCKEVDVKYVWTSKAERGGAVIQYGITHDNIPPNFAYDPDEHPGQFVSCTPKSTPAPTTTVSRADIDFGTNARNEDGVDYEINAYYKGEYDTEAVRGTRDIYQTEDRIVGTQQEVNPDFPYQAVIAGYNSIAFVPTGIDYNIGTPSLDVRAWHEERTNTVWESQAIDLGQWEDVEDPYILSQDEGVVQEFHFPLTGPTGPDADNVYHYLIGHGNMYAREQDKVQFRVENGHDSSAYSYFPSVGYITVNNEVVDSYYEDHFSVHLQDDAIGYTGGNVDILYSAYESYTREYQSHYILTVTSQEYIVNLAANYGSVSPGAVSGTGVAVLSVPQNDTFFSRAVRVDMYYTGSASVDHDSLTQDPHPPVFTLDLGETQLTFYASGRYSAGSVYTLDVTGIRTDGEGQHSFVLSASDLTITKSGDSGGRISRNGLDFTAGNLGTQVYAEVWAQYVISWDDHPEATATFLCGQEANVVEQTIPRHSEVSGFGGLIFNPASIPVAGGGVIVTGTATLVDVAAEYIWTSNEHSGGERTPGGTTTVSPDRISCSSASTIIQPDEAYFDSNAHVLSPVTSHTIVAEYGEFTASGDISQAADTYTETTEYRNYAADLSLYNTQNLNAVGGRCTYTAEAWHEERTRYNWASGGYTYSQWHTVYDTCSVYSDSQYFSASDGDIIHQNMERRPSDSVTFTAVNDNDQTATDTWSLTVTQTITQTSDDLFSLESDISIASADGDTATISFVSLTQTVTTYESGPQYTDIDEVGLTSSIVASIGTLSGSTAFGRGSVTLTIPANQSYSMRTIVLDLYYDGDRVGGTSIQQQPAIRPLEDYIIVTETAYASGRLLEFENTYSASLLATVSLEFYDQTTSSLAYSTQWVGRIAAGATERESYPGYGYGYDLIATVVSAQL